MKKSPKEILDKIIGNLISDSIELDLTKAKIMRIQKMVIAYENNKTKNYVYAVKRLKEIFGLMRAV
jgi:hypothetical protein